MNFIYINPDEMRANVLGCYGHPLVQTPNIDRLAKEGVRFDQCHVQHTVCTSSRCSFLTGWYPHTRGHRTLWNSLRPDEPNTFRYLKQSGYDVHWMGKNDALAQECFADSVSKIHGPKGRPVTCEPVFEKGKPGAMSFLTGPLSDHPHDYYLYERAARVIRAYKEGDKPFMIFLPTSLPHCPYHAPQPWHDMYDPDDLPPLKPADLEGKPIYHKLIRQYRDLDKMDEKDLRKVMAVYLGMVSYVDYMISMVLDALDETGLADNTTVTFFSDHGDWAGDFGLVEKWPSGLDDCLTRIPMIVRSPGNKVGHVVAEPTECFDIMPTTLELAGIKAQHTHFARSMVPQLQGAAGDPERAACADGGYDMHEPHCFEGKPSDGVCGNKDGIYYPKGKQQQEVPESVCRASMLRSLQHKLIWRSSGENELYDLTVDPDELHNVFGEAEYGAVQQDLVERMLTWYLRTSDVTPFDMHTRGIDAETAAGLDLADVEYEVAAGVGCK